jgi:hypothetical protein
MKSETVAAIKSEMEYTEQPAPSCAKCRHSEERDDPMLDRSWVRVCKFNALGTITVADHGRCSRFSPTDH